MVELIDRAEIPMQPIDDRGSGISGTVPVYLGTEALSTEVTLGVLDIGSATEAVRATYDEDMAEYLASLHKQGYDLHHLRGYEEFQPTWSLDVEPSELTSLPRLIWREGEDIHVLQHDPVPVTFHNRHDENGNFYTPEFWKRKGIFPIAYRSVMDPVFMFMEPDKMRQFGLEVPELHAVIDPEGHIADVVGTSFDSAYKDNLAQALLLRNLGVYYMNQLSAELPTLS